MEQPRSCVETCCACCGLRLSDLGSLVAGRLVARQSRSRSSSQGRGRRETSALTRLQRRSSSCDASSDVPANAYPLWEWVFWRMEASGYKPQQDLGPEVATLIRDMKRLDPDGKEGYLLDFQVRSTLAMRAGSKAKELEMLKLAAASLS